MRPWWEADPAALAREIRALAAAGFTPTSQTVALPGHWLRLEVRRGRRRIELEFEDNYPAGGAVFARALAEGTQPRMPLSSVSAAGNATPEPRVDDWFATARGPEGATVALQRVLHRSRNERDEWVHAVRRGRVILPAEWRAMPNTGHGALVFGLASGGACVPLQITGLPTEQRTRLTDAALPFARAFPASRLHGIWATGARLEGSGASLAAQIETQLAGAHGMSVGALRAQLVQQVGALVIPDQFLSLWHFVRRSPAGEPMLMDSMFCETGLYEDRAPYARALVDRHVAIIGCGAVGWAVALLLARSGVRRFTLYDNDTIVPGNLARLGAFLGDSGTFKATTLAKQLEAITPGVKVTRSIASVGHQVGASALLEGAPDLYLNLTGEELSTDETNLAALRSNTPAIFAWVSYGVAAARIFRVRPFASACYECVREAYLPRLPTADRWFDRGRPWVGSVIDVDAFAAAVAQVAVKTLRKLPVSKENPDHVVLAFDGLTPQARRIRVARDQRCRLCR